MSPNPEDLPTISQSEHDARVARGEQATGRYAFVFPRRTAIQESLTYSYDVRDESDQDVVCGPAQNAYMARLHAERAGATFIVDEI